MTAGNTYKLDPPFFVMATQNPIEQEGTYPLPEAQLDRFMLSINIGYPRRDEEREIVMATTQAAGKRSGRCCRGRTSSGFSSWCARCRPASTWSITRSIWPGRRGPRSPGPDFVKNWLAWGAGPRAAQYMILGAKARAIFHGRFAVSADDVRAVLIPCCGIGCSPISTPTPRDRRGPGDREDVADRARADLRRARR